MTTIKDENIQTLAIKMVNGDIEAKNKIINHYIEYINKTIQTHFDEFDIDKEVLKNKMMNFLYRTIDSYSGKERRPFSYLIINKFTDYCKAELAKLKNKAKYKNREIQKLAIKMINGDEEALNKIIEFYSYHIRCLAKTKYKFSNIDEEDLVQIGIIGLLKAKNLYNEDKDSAFSIYVNSYIQKEIIREIKKRNKSVETESIGLNNNYNKTAFNDFVEAEEVKNIIEQLSTTKKNILYLYFYGRYSFKEIGEILGFTEANAHLNYKEALEIIKQKLLMNNLNQKKL